MPIACSGAGGEGGVMTRLILGLAAVALLWFVATDSGAQPQKREGAAGAPPAGWAQQVKGYGQTVADAKEDAFAKALKRVTESLKNHNPPLVAWQPDQPYVRTHLIEGPPEGEQGEDVKLNVGVVKEWIVTLREPSKTVWSDMVARNQIQQREEWSIERQTLAGYVLAALTGVLALIWGYLRLDEWTGGTITRSLRIGAVALALLAGLVWWMSM
jgi:hypothetical protein